MILKPLHLCGGKFTRYSYSAELLEHDETSILSGSKDHTRFIAIDDIFGKKFSEVEADLMAAIGIKKDPRYLSQAVTTPFHTWIQQTVSEVSPILISNDNYYRVIELEHEGVDLGLAFVSGDGVDNYHIRGLLLGADLVVANGYRGFGAGTALIQSELLRSGSLPTWDHDTPGYSYGGAQVCRRALSNIHDLLHEALKELNEDIEPH